MTVIDSKTNTVVSTNLNQNTEFSEEQIQTKILATVDKDLPEDVLSMLLADEDLRTSAIALLRKDQENMKLTAVANAKKKMEQLLKGSVSKPVTVDDMDTRISKMLKYQQDTHSVMSPKFVFSDVDTAASWRRYLINFIIGLRNLMKVVDKTSPDGMLLASKAAFLQTHIDAADAVLEGFWKVPTDYRTQEDKRKHVEMDIFMHSEYGTYQELVQDMDTTITSLKAKYTNNNVGHRADEGGETPQTRPNGKKKGKHARHMPQD